MFLRLNKIMLTAAAGAAIVAAVAGPAGARASAARPGGGHPRASAPVGVTVTGDLTWSLESIPVNAAYTITGADRQAGTFHVDLPHEDANGYPTANNSTYTISDNLNTSWTDKQSGCTISYTGGFSGSGTFPLTPTTGSPYLYAAVLSTNPHVDTIIGVPFTEAQTTTWTGPAPCYNGTSTGNLAEWATPACLTSTGGDDGIIGTFKGTYPAGVVNISCSGTFKNSVEHGSFSVTGELLTCQDGSSKPERVVCLADQAVAGQPLPGWQGGSIPYSWGGGHSAIGPSLGTCVGYHGPHASECATWPKGPTHTVGLDCSGFTRWIYDLAYGGDVLGGGNNNSQRINPEMSPDTGATPSLGDLVFYQDSQGIWDHVGILIAPGVIADEPHTLGFLRTDTVGQFGTPHYYTYGGS